MSFFPSEHQKLSTLRPKKVKVVRNSKTHNDIPKMCAVVEPSGKIPGEDDMSLVDIESKIKSIDKEVKTEVFQYANMKPYKQIDCMSATRV